VQRPDQQRGQPAPSPDGGSQLAEQVDYLTRRTPV